MSGDKKDIFDFDPWDGTPGDAWEKFEARLWNGTTKTDDRGWSLVDHLKGQDEGQPPPIGTGIAFPASRAPPRRSRLGEWRCAAAWSHQPAVPSHRSAGALVRSSGA